ncbi:MAG: hypothetical protein H7Y13_11480 [Sphingobacteriaceae bacterium]|nr:hypothetical protein [Sphingobacteriaceae bacterium]
MNKLISAFIVFTVLVGYSCNRSSKSTKEQNVETDTSVVSTSYTTLNADWILGKWEIEMPQGRLFEVWEKKNDSTYQAHSYYLLNKDTISSAIVLIEKRGNTSAFIQKGQKGKKDTSFPLIFMDSKKLIFENPEKGYPQKISYSVQSENSLVEEVSGKVGDKDKADKFVLKRLE